MAIWDHYAEVEEVLLSDGNWLPVERGTLRAEEGFLLFKSPFNENVHYVLFDHVHAYVVHGKGKTEADENTQQVSEKS